MTFRQAYEYALIEINKLEAPSMLLEDYVYLFNKAVQQKVNEIYNRFDVNQQTTDDLSVLQVISTLDTAIHKDDSITKISQFTLPDNYFHLLNCIAVFEMSGSDKKCYTDSPIVTTTKGCKKLTSDIYPQVISNSYMKPTYTNPYFFVIGNVDNNELNDIKIHYGLNDKASVKKIIITYLKKPKVYTLTQSELDSMDDTSETLEFTDYMCYEIINTYIKLILENYSDPRLQSVIPINHSIAVAGTQK